MSTTILFIIWMDTMSFIYPEFGTQIAEYSDTFSIIFIFAVLYDILKK